MSATRSLPSTLPTNRRPEASSSSVARWIRRSPLPFSSPIDSSATRGCATPTTRSAKIAPIRAYCDEVLGRRVGVGADVEEHERPARADHLHGQGRAIDAGEPPDSEDGGGHRRAGVARGHHGVRASVPDEVTRDGDRRVLLLAQGEGGMLVHLDDLARRDDLDVRRQLARDLRDPRAVTHEEDVVLGMGPGVIESAGNDLGRAVVATHRVDREANPAGAGGDGHVPTAWKERLPSGP